MIIIKIRVKKKFGTNERMWILILKYQLKFIR